MTVDLNCDMGEGMGHDAELMQYVSSANIACGFHAGDPEIMTETVALAMKFGVAIGAHPSFPDRENFGRTTMKLSAGAIYELVLDQVRSLHAIAKERNARLHHMKPHGALYNMAAVNTEISTAIVSAVQDFDPHLILYGLANSELIKVAKLRGLSFKQEVFADRTYQPDGTLTPRSQPNALIDHVDDSIKQVIQMIKEKTATATNGERVVIQADTICLHGDGPHAVEFAKAIHSKLSQAGVKISSAS